MKYLARWFLVLALVIGCAGCTGLPTSGVVGSAPREGSSQDPGDVAIIPDPPSQGASPSQIVQGFLNAMVNSEQGYATARAYLTHTASAAWTPDAEALIYASGITPRVNGDQVSITGALVGRLSADGAYSSVDNPSWTHDFGLVIEDNQWRISRPTTGLALSQYMFSQTYTRVEAYFFDDTATVLVPDSRYVPIGSWNAARAVRLVLNGPSTWLSPVTDNTYRSRVELDSDVYTSGGGVLTVPLSGEAAGLDIQPATQLALEIAATTRDMASVVWIRLTVAGQGLALDPRMGAATDDALAKVAADQYTRASSSAPADLFFVSSGYVYRADATTRSRLPSDWGTTPHDISSFAVNRDSAVIAAATPDGLLVGGAFDGELTIELSEPGILRPQFASDRTLWAMASNPQGTAAWTRYGGTMHQVAATGLAGLVVQGFQLAPDGRRVLLLVRPVQDPEGPMRVGVALITTTNGQPSSIVSFKQIQATFQGSVMTSIIDAAWMGPSSMVLLGATQQGRAAEVFYTDRDGLSVEEWGNPEQWAATQMAAHAQQVSVLEEQGQVWTYQEGQQWAKVGDNVSAIAYPG
ncbi:MAG: LpqB family beta-propeller domain-containing protein [Propionibacteriaceae bacterium]|jgi:hypothetical protein|nr:LpqB family beta-propeller domain-containing protein [Propionibacteriaceae bacterium]